MSNRIEDGTHLVWLVKAREKVNWVKKKMLYNNFKCDKFSEILFKYTNEAFCE